MSAPVPTADRSSLDRVLDALGTVGSRVQQRGDHADAQCPAHDDRNPSLSIDWRAGDKGGVTVLYCHQGCDTVDALTALGLRWVDLYDTPATGGQAQRPKKSTRTRSDADTPARTTTSSEGKRRSTKLPPVEAEYPYAREDGEIVGWLVRHEGKQFRWNKPGAGGRRVPGAPEHKPLYLLPLVAQAVAAGQPVHLTEGEKDADALAATGLAATTIPGGAVVTQRGTLKGNVAEAHLAALTGGHIVIWADRDGPDAKDPARGYVGYHHALHLHRILEPVAASVRVVEAATGKDAADHLAAEHTPDAAVEIDPAVCVPTAVRTRWADALGQPIPGADSDLSDAGADEQVPDNVYSLPSPSTKTGGGGGGGSSDQEPVYLRDEFKALEDALVKVQRSNSGITYTEVINARVRLLRRVLRDLGEGTQDQSLVDLEVTQGDDTHTVESLEWDDFENPTKWAKKVPLPLQFGRGQTGKSNLINAILQTSGVVPLVQAYGMLGWREIAPDRWVYLHAGGAIGAEGQLLGTRVEVSPRLRGFKLPEPPTGDELRASYDAVMTLMDTLPHRIGVPLIAAAARAVLGDCSTSLFLLGKTGTYKSGLAALAQQMFDPSARYDHLPAGAGEGAGTGSGVEHLLYEAGHSVLVLDDLAPDRGSARSAARGAELIRQVGNRQSKLRSNRDANGLRMDKPPRAFVILTGEDQPTVQSAERRTIYLRVARGDVSKAMLRDLSRPELRTARPGLIAAMAQRTAQTMPNNEWLEEQRDTYAEYLTAGQDDADGLVAGRANTIAELAIGLRALLDTVVEAGVVSREEAAQRWHDAWAALRDTRDAQFDIVDRRSLPERAADLLRSALHAGRAHLRARSGGRPPNPAQCGWEPPTDPTFEPRPAGRTAGWTDGEWMWFDPQTLFGLLAEQGRAVEDPLDVTQRALKTALAESGTLSVDEPVEPGRVPRDPRRTIVGRRQRVWEMPLSWLYPDDADPDDGVPDEDTTPPPPTGPEPEDTDRDPQQPTLDQTPENTSEKTTCPREDPDTHIRRHTGQSSDASTSPRRGRTTSSEPRYDAAGVVVDVDAAYLIGSPDPVSRPEMATFGDLMAWAVTLNLGVQHDGPRRTKTSESTGIRDDAGLVVVMPRLARKLGAPSKAPRRDKPIARNHKAVKALETNGWKLGERGMQSYTQVWRSEETGKAGRAHFLVFPHWSSEPIFQNLPEAAQVAYRLNLYVGTLGYQLVYSAASTGAGLVRQLRGITNKPLTKPVTAVPSPAADKMNAPLEDLEWDYWRPLTACERDECTHIVGVDVNASYLAAAATAVLGHGPAEHYERPNLDEFGDLRKRPGYWTLEPNNDPMPHELLPDLLDPHGAGRRSDPVTVTTPRLLALHDAGLHPHVHEAWVYSDPGSYLQVWAKTLRNAVYELKEYTADVDDPDADAVLSTLKLTYAAGLGQLDSQRWRRDTPLWLPHWNQTVKGQAQATIWRKVHATGKQTGRYPVGIARDTIYYATSSPDMEAVPLNTDGGFAYDRSESYRIGHTKWAATATVPDYLAAQAVTDKAAHVEAMNSIWTTPNTVGDRNE